MEGRPYSQATEQRLEAAFKGLLTLQAWAYLKTLPPDTLQQDQKDSLKRLYDHFIDSDLGADTEASSENPNLSRLSTASPKRRLDDSFATESDSIDSLRTSNQPKKRGRPRKTRESSDSLQLVVNPTAISTNDSWGAARKLKHLDLDDALSTQIRLNPKLDATKFLTEQTSLIEVSHQRRGDLTRDQALIESFISTKLQRQSNVLGQVRYLFRILLIGDIGNTIFGKKKRSINHEQLAEFGGFIDKRYERMTDQEKDSAGLKGKDAPVEQLRQDLKIVVRRGMRLAGFCDRFGTGSLFWLHSILKDNFIDNRWTELGDAHDLAMQNFEKLELAKKNDESGANALGDAIRRHLRYLYNVDNFDINNEQQDSGTEGGTP